MDKQSIEEEYMTSALSFQVTRTIQLTQSLAQELANQVGRATRIHTTVISHCLLWVYLLIKDHQDLNLTMFT